ncbi:hypothetical protein CTI14_06620 [Methylobacterium radiotolerans]|nr:hypothetical protein CTI14_06620 [Methylobacterium radiotolerans]
MASSAFFSLAQRSVSCVVRMPVRCEVVVLGDRLLGPLEVQGLELPLDLGVREAADVVGDLADGAEHLGFDARPLPVVAHLGGPGLQQRFRELREVVSVEAAQGGHELFPALNPQTAPELVPEVVVAGPAQEVQHHTGAQFLQAGHLFAVRVVFGVEGVLNLRDHLFGGVFELLLEVL